jgi:tetratricopeptide (TPR) repeat protein
MVQAPMGRPIVLLGAGACLAAAIALQAVRNASYPPDTRLAQQVLYLRSGEALRRLALEFDAVAADAYWIRAIQHYGGERLARDRPRNYDLLYPLLDLTTSLDPYFTIAYRFGAIFLSEPYPGGPGRPDQAIALLEKGLQAQPHKWQYFHDIAFVHYWHLRDPRTAAGWFERAAQQPDAPNWLQPLAATMLTSHDRRAARFLWEQILNSDQTWLQRTARRSLMQIDAMDAIDALEALVRRYPPAAGEPYSWDGLVRRGALRGVPADPAGQPFEIDPSTGSVRVSPRSMLSPMPAAEQLTR